MECCLMRDQDFATMVVTKEEDAYDERKPSGIEKEGQQTEEEKEDENFEIDMAAENCYTLRKIAAFTLDRLAKTYPEEVY